MAKLYAPILYNSIPAFYRENDAIKISLPFIMNRAVSPVQVKAMMVKIKNIQSTTTLTEQIVDTTFESNIMLEENSLEFSIVDKAILEKLYPTNSYKFQIAYIDQNDNVGYYSNVAIGKCTTKPEVKIEGLSTTLKNTCNYTFTGIYNQYNKDTTEKVYSYNFEVLNDMFSVVYTTGELIHNHSTDVENYESTDSFILPMQLEASKDYTIRYNITTINGLKLSSPEYIIRRPSESTTTEVNMSLEAKNNFEDGFIELNIKNNATIKKSLIGKLVLSRTDESSAFTEWQTIKEIVYNNEEVPAQQSYKDFIVTQGVEYKYSVQWIDKNNKYTTKKYSNVVYCDFEDMFLYDGDRQLKIRFNPKVSSFKINKQEQKIETLGSQFPFFLKSGNVNYAEFPISGLISYLMDENEFFVPLESLFPKDWDKFGYVITQELYGYNIAAERKFKLNVLNWLANGKPKLFRSPTEGNYIVQLMNVSMAPNDSLGRMLHTFTCNAYECHEFNQFNCKKYLRGLTQSEREDIVSDILKRLKSPILVDEYGNKYYLLAKSGKIYFEKMEEA